MLSEDPYVGDLMFLFFFQRCSENAKLDSWLKMSALWNNMSISGKFNRGIV